jgi:3-oxoacyl-(acyl-carrier-protein) synthase
MAIEAVRLAMGGSAAPLLGPGSSTAVLLGTACAEEGDEIAFLEHLVKRGEKGARPAYFVNSVKNALASQVALTFGWPGENQTFHHDALSFETALWYGARLLCANRAERAVVCGVDALAEFAEIQGHLLGQLHTDPTQLAPLSGRGPPGGRGSLPGEGAAAFIVAPPGTTASPLGRIVGVRSRGPLEREPRLDASQELRFVEQAVADMGATMGDIGLVLLGANGDPELDRNYAAIAAGLRPLVPRAATGVYRHLVGDFATASALGLALAVRTVAEQAVPEEIRLVAGRAENPTLVLLYHLTTAGRKSVILVSAGGH